MGVLVPRCPSRSPRGVGGRGQVRCALRIEAVHTYIRNCVGCYIVRFHDTPIIPRDNVDLLRLSPDAANVWVIAATLLQLTVIADDQLARLR